MVRKREKEVNDLETKIGKINMEIKNCERQVSFYDSWEFIVMY